MQTEKRVRLQIGRGRQDQLNVFLGMKRYFGSIYAYSRSGLFFWSSL